MIADDMMSFIKNDIIIFGVGVFIFIIATLWFILKICLDNNPFIKLFFLIIMMGMLGLLEWKVTVISSNFIALMLILTMAMNIHLSTRFLQIKNRNSKYSKVKTYSIRNKKNVLANIIHSINNYRMFLSLIFSGINQSLTLDG